jgi:hypothetical protein
VRRAELSWDHRQHAEETETVSALRALLAGVVDYAGLYPPAGLGMGAAVRNYAAYRAHDDSWMLGRFVVPAARLAEFTTELRALGDQAAPEWRLSAVLGADVEADVERVRAFNREHRGRACADSLEGKVDSVEGIHRAAAASGSNFALFAEIPSGADTEMLIAAVKQASVNAKIRTGGVTTEAFPTPESVVHFMRRCISADVRFKATAGLHHAVRGDYRLTYDAAAPTGTMFGFLNLLFAAGLLYNGRSDADALAALDERDPGAFTTTPTTIRWRDIVLDEDRLRALRDRAFVSFGSCSFNEPVDELHALVLVP